MTEMAATTSRWLRLAQLGYLSSVALQLAWVFTGSSQSSLEFQLILLIPILFPAVGIIQAKPYTHAWSGFIAALYLLSSATAWWVYPNDRPIASVVIITLFCWLFGSTYFARSRGRELGLSLKKAKTKP